MGKTLRKSWQEKLSDSKDLPRVVEINERMSQRWVPAHVSSRRPWKWTP